VFGLSFGELCVLLIVAVVVLGPKELPRYLRKAGQLAGQLRRMAFEMREKSGIDQMLRTEGIDRDIAEIQRLARGEIGAVAASVRSTADVAKAAIAGTNAYVAPVPSAGGAHPPASSEREYPGEGPDAYGAMPDTATVYEPLAPSPLAEDPLYLRGVPEPERREANGEAHAPSEPA
jgi:sec-independent protein translocase protein TatB